MGVLAEGKRAGQQILHAEHQEHAFVRPVGRRVEAAGRRRAVGDSAGRLFVFHFRSGPLQMTC